MNLRVLIEVAYPVKKIKSKYQNPSQILIPIHVPQCNHGHRYNRIQKMNHQIVQINQNDLKLFHFDLSYLVTYAQE